MRFMISSSDRALARADFRRFWPLLFGYAVLWLCALPLALWSRRDYLNPRRPMEVMASVSNYFYNASRASIYVSAFFAVLLERSLSDLQDNTVKLQVAFGGDDPEMPASLNILHHEKIGRVHTYIVRGNQNDILAQVSALQPILLEAIPLTLEEIFIYELGGADYAVHDIVL